jgi:APA family basic amino acid/polyamine antiporter
MGVLTALTLMLTLPLSTWIRLIVWMMFGLLIYLIYGMHHSKLGKPEPEGDLIKAA